MGPNEVNGVYHLIVCLFSANEKQEIKITHPPYLFCDSSNVILKNIYNNSLSTKWIINDFFYRNLSSSLKRVTFF